MEHIALYRKWRPQVFEDLVGQEPISRTILNAISTNRISHAYLFCGSRGTGKTTTARLLAKSLNCEARVNGSPCNQCPSCNEQSSGSALDVIEIDAASNRGISEIKSLIEQVRFASVAGKYKVYIIDEFHMLTTEAFNAILKTLEEPPAKVVFVLATTEAHKILPTIISRCQRFDFQRIPVSALVGRLRYISDQEGIKISDDSLLSIARKANGGLRDALSLLDQISSFSDNNEEIPTELVYQVLGMVSNDYLAKLVEAIAAKEPVKVMEVLSDLVKSGSDPVIIITETIAFLRNLLIVKSAPETAEFLEVPVISLESLKKLGSLFSTQDILAHLEFLNEAIERVKKTQQAQLWLEVNFVQMCKSANVTGPIAVSASGPTAQSEHSQLINKIAELEKRLESLTEKLSSGQFSVSSGHEPKRESSLNRPKTETGNNGNGSSHPKTEQAGNNPEFSNLWERILHETKKQSIPAAALLANGELAHVDSKVYTVTIKFENEGFIELLKKSKYQRVEQALSVIFGNPYKLIMEKGLVKEEKKNHKLDSMPNLSLNSPISSANDVIDINKNFNTFESSQIIVPAVNISNEENNSPQREFNAEDMGNGREDGITVSSEQNNYVGTQSTLSTKITEENIPLSAAITEQNYFNGQTEAASATATLVKEETGQYTVATSFTEVEVTENLVDSVKKEKALYFKDVADIFKGKIINKVKK